jgi:hypothetical protein
MLFSDDELGAIGLSATQQFGGSDRFQPIYQRWRKKRRMVWRADAVFARDPEPASARRHSFARINRGAHPCAFA